MTMPWENNDNDQSWEDNDNNHDNHDDTYSWENNQDQEDNTESLEDLFGDDSSDDSDNHDSNGDNDEKENDSQTLDDVEEELATVPTKRSQATPQFSERDVYQIVNLNTVLGVLDETQASWMDIIFGTASNTDNIKRSIRIVAMESSEIDDKIKPVEALQSLYYVSQETDPSKIINNILDSIKTVDDLSTSDKGSLVSLMRKMAKNHADANGGKTVPIRVTRNSSSAEIVDAMRNLIEENPAVSESLSSLSQFIDVIRTALK